MFKFLVVLFYVINPIFCYTIKPIQVPENNFLTGGYWDAFTQNFYFCDLVAEGETPSIFRYDFTTGKTYSAYVIGLSSLSYLIPIEGCQDKFVIGVDNTTVISRWDGVSKVAVVIRTLFNYNGHANQALVDLRGRLFSGTLNVEVLCSTESDYPLYRYSRNKGSIEVLTNIKSSGGLAINPVTNKFYHVDSCRFEIAEFDYDPSTGDICNGRVVFDVKNLGYSLPYIHGMTIDRNGNLYVNLYAQFDILVIDPRQSKLLDTIHLPSKGLIGIAFAGPNSDKLIVISSKTILDTYGGEVKEVRPQDQTFFIIEDLNASGFASKRAEV